MQETFFKEKFTATEEADTPILKRFPAAANFLQNSLLLKQISIGEVRPDLMSFRSPFFMGPK